MNRKVLWPAIKELLISAIAGGSSLVWWPLVKEELQPLLPNWVGPVTAWLTFWGFFASMAAMRMELIKASHPIWVIGYFVGATAFLSNLLIQVNVGNVCLQIALITATVRKMLAPTGELKDPIPPWKWRWVAAPIVMGFACWVGGAIIPVWPHSWNDRLSDNQWAAISLFGATSLLIAVVFQWNGVLDGLGWRFASLYGAGNLSLVCSYLGQYSEAGLRLNVAMAIIMITSIVIALVRDTHKK